MIEFWIYRVEYLEVITRSFGFSVVIGLNYIYEFNYLKNISGEISLDEC